MAAEGSGGIDALGQFQLHTALGPIGHSVNFTLSNLMMVVAGLLTLLLLWVGMRPRAMVPDRLQAAAPEPLVPQFRVTPAMVLNVIARPGNAFLAMRHLILSNHSTFAAKRAQTRAAIRAYGALLAAGVVERRAGLAGTRVATCDRHLGLPVPHEDDRHRRLVVEPDALARDEGRARHCVRTRIRPHSSQRTTCSGGAVLTFSRSSGLSSMRQP